MHATPRNTTRRATRSLPRSLALAIGIGALVSTTVVPATAHAGSWSHAHRQATIQPAGYGNGLGDWQCAAGFDSRQLFGGLLGAALGGLLGSQIGDGSGQLAATATGTLLGAVLGGSIAGEMTGADRECVAESLESAPVGQSVSWRNPDTDRSYSVTPTRTVRHHGRYCREYQTTITVGGRAEEGYGTACRQPDGSWEIVG